MRMKACSALGALLLAACTTHADGTQSVNKTAVGAGVGAVAGGVLGNRLDKGNRVRGTVIGAAAGAAAGAGLGYLMDRQEADLREQLANERTDHAIELERVRDDLLKLTLANEISFDFGSAAIKPAFKPTMSKLAEVLRKYDRNEITIVGHTDAAGSDSYNQTLSERRAVAVRDELDRARRPVQPAAGDRPRRVRAARRQRHRGRPAAQSPGRDPGAVAPPEPSRRTSSFAPIRGTRATSDRRSPGRRGLIEGRARAPSRARHPIAVCPACRPSSLPTQRHRPARPPSRCSAALSAGGRRG